MWYFLKRGLLVILLLGFAGACSYLYFFGFEREIRFGEPLNELPAQTLALIKIDRPGALLDALDNQPNVRELLGDDPVLSQWMAALREVPHENHPNAWVRDLDVLLAVVPKPNSTDPALIWGIGLPTGLSDRQAIDQFEQLFLQRAEKTELTGATAFTFQTDPPCMGIMQNDAMFLSTSKDVLNYISQPKNPRLTQLPDFMNTWQSQGEADANCMINLKRFPIEIFAPQITPAKELANWTSIDIKLLNQGVELNGVFFGTEKHRLNGANSSRIPPAVLPLVPKIADQFVFRSWENPMDFAEVISIWNQTPLDREALSKKRWFQHCLAWADEGIGHFTIADEPYVILGMADTTAFFREINTVNGSITHTSNIPRFTWERDSLWENSLPTPYNFAVKAGCILENYIILGRSEQSIDHFLSYSHRREPNQKTIEELQIGRPQIYAYSDLNYFGDQLEGAWKTYWDEHSNAWNELAESIHFTAYTEEERAFFRVRLQHDSLRPGGPVLEWDQALTQKAEDAVWILDHRSGEYYALANNGESLFALDARGTLRWSLNMRNPIQSKPQAIDLYKNGKIQVIFNTANAIHCLDVKGRQVDGFPIQLPANTSSELAVFDYDDNRDYRFLIATEDGNILNFQQEGISTKGWKYRSTSSPVRMLKHVKAGARDYLFALHEDGEIQLLKRNGEVRFQTDLKIKGNPANIQFQMRKDIASSRVLFADQNDQVLDQTFGDGSNGSLSGIAEGQHILVEDLDNDRINDLLVIDDNRLMVYDAAGRVILNTSDILLPDLAPATYRFQGGKKIGLVNRSMALTSILDLDGKQLDGFPIEGASTPSIRDADGDGKLELLTVSLTGKVICYELE